MPRKSKSSALESQRTRTSTPRMNSAQHSRAYAGAYAAKLRKRRRKRTAVVAVVAAVVLVFAGAGTAAALYLQDVENRLNGQGVISEEEQMQIQEQLAPTTTFDEPFYMLLIGSDRRAEDESMGARSDTNILVRVDAPNKSATMISIPRDTRINIEGHGWQKFNAAYTFDGIAGTIREASELCNVKISHYAEVNFEELTALVDAIGGVEIDVPYRIDDPDAGAIVIEPGMQTLDGEAALVFARTRQFADGDFTRAANQRLLIEAIINKVFTMPATELMGVVQAASQCVITDFSVMDVFSLVTQFREGSGLTMYSAMVPSTTDYIGDVSYVLTDEAGLRNMMKIVEEGGDPNDAVTSGSIGSALNDNHTLELGDAAGSSEEDAEAGADEAGASGARAGAASENATSAGSRTA